MHMLHTSTNHWFLHCYFHHYMQELKQETRKLFLDCKQLHIRKGEDIRLTPYKHKKSFEYECVFKCAYVCVYVCEWVTFLWLHEKILFIPWNRFVIGNTSTICLECVRIILMFQPQQVDTYLLRISRKFYKTFDFVTFVLSWIVFENRIILYDWSYIVVLWL